MMETVEDKVSKKQIKINSIVFFPENPFLYCRRLFLFKPRFVLNCLSNLAGKKQPQEAAGVAG